MIIGRVFENPCDVYDFIKSHDRSLTTFFDVLAEVDDIEDLEMLQDSLENLFSDMNFRDEKDLIDWFESGQVFKDFAFECESFCDFLGMCKGYEKGEFDDPKTWKTWHKKYFY